jgi:hypothetical protein
LGQKQICDDHRNQAIQKRVECFEAPSVEPVFLTEEQAIDYAKCRACFRSGEDSHSGLKLSETSPQTFRINITGGETAGR